MTDAPLDLAELKRLLATDSEINTLNRFYSSGQYSASEEAIFDAAAKELFELRRLSGALIARLEQAEAALIAIRNYPGPKWSDDMTLREKIAQQCDLYVLPTPPKPEGPER